jgi:hypothetical protein
MTNQKLTDMAKEDLPILTPHELMIFYLRLSPSYELAKEIKEKKLSKSKSKVLIEKLYANEDEQFSKIKLEKILRDFELVLKTYDKFGDVSLPMSDWWRLHGGNTFGHHYEVLKVESITRLQKGDEGDKKEITKNIQNYLQKRNEHLGLESTVIMAVPLNMTPSKILRQVKRFLRRPYVKKIPKEVINKFPWASRRINRTALADKQQLLYFRLRYPEMPLWKHGIKLRFSKTFAKLLEREKDEDKILEYRANMTILVSRGLKAAKTIAENAARGSFPNPKPVDLPNYDDSGFIERYELSRKHRMKIYDQKKALADKKISSKPIPLQP